MGAVQDGYITVAWLVLLVVLLVIEIITVGLTTIWGSRRCAGGTDPEYSGCTVCRTGGCIFVVTILLLVFTRPFAMRFINTPAV